MKPYTFPFEGKEDNAEYETENCPDYIFYKVYIGNKELNQRFPDLIRIKYHNDGRENSWYFDYPSVDKGYEFARSVVRGFWDCI
jgi:hypothetical protein